MNPTERQELTELIEKDNGENWWVPEAFTNKIFKILHPSLKVIKLPPEYVENYNCFVYTFNLDSDPYFLGGNNPIQQEFVKHLLKENILHSTKSPGIGDLVFYRDDMDNITHGGILKSKDIVVSKWMWGPIIENRLFDVPSSFGDEVFYCKAVPPNVIKDEYNLYKNSGVEIKPIS